MALSRQLRVQAPWPAAGEGEIEEDETIENCRVAPVKNCKEAVRRVADEIADGHLTCMMAAARENRPGARSATWAYGLFGGPHRPLKSSPRLILLPRRAALHKPPWVLAAKIAVTIAAFVVLGRYVDFNVLLSRIRTFDTSNIVVAIAISMI